MSESMNPITTTLDPSSDKKAWVLAVTSGKGGVGKTFVSANVAAGLAKLGHRVLVLDADLGLANLDVVLNLYPKLTLHDVFVGRCKLEEAILPAPGGFSVVLAGSGLVEYSRLTPEVRDKFQSVVASLIPRYDYVLLDTGAGISDVVLYAVSLADDVLVVATPEPTSMTDAYATIKVLATQQRRRELRLVINQVTKAGDGKGVAQQLQQVVDRFVSTPAGDHVKLTHLGDIPSDPSVRQAVQKRQLLLESLPGSAAALAIKAIAGRVEAAQERV